MTSGTVFTQEFDTLPTSGSGAFNQFDSGGPTLGNAFAVRTGTGGLIAASAGADGTGNLYSFGTGTTADRALGSIASGNSSAGNFAYGFVFQNTGGEVLNINVRYVGEQWRNSGAAAQTVSFSYQTTATAPTSEGLRAATSAASTPDPTGFTPVDALDFTSPVTGGTAGALNGNAAANRVAFDVDVSVALPAGGYLTLYFSDPDNAAAADHGLAIDSVRVAFTPVPEPAAVVALAAGGLGLLRLRRRPG